MASTDGLITETVANAPRMPRPLLLLLGDSLTEMGAQPDGWVSLLAQRFHSSADVAQRGLSGYTTQMFLDVVMAALVVDLAMALHPQLIAIWLGANDAALPGGSSGAQHVPLARYKANLHALVTALRGSAPQTQILLITPPPVDDAVRLAHARGGPVDRSNAAAEVYARACVDVAQEAGVAVLDLYSVFTTAGPGGQWRALLSDGLHLSARGNRVVEYLVAEAIQTEFPALYAQLEQAEFPPFQQLLDEAGDHNGVCVVSTSHSSLLSSLGAVVRRWGFGWEWLRA